MLESQTTRSLSKKRNFVVFNNRLFVPITKKEGEENEWRLYAFADGILKVNWKFSDRVSKKTGEKLNSKLASGILYFDVYEEKFACVTKKKLFVFNFKSSKDILITKVAPLNSLAIDSDVLVCISQNKRYFLVYDLQRPKDAPTEITFPGQNKLRQSTTKNESENSDKNLNQIKIVLTHNCINFIETIKQNDLCFYATYSYKKKGLNITTTPRIENFEWIHSMESEVRDRKSIPKREGIFFICKKISILKIQLFFFEQI